MRSTTVLQTPHGTRADAGASAAVSRAWEDDLTLFEQSLAKGFVDLWGLPSRLAMARDVRLGG